MYICPKDWYKVKKKKKSSFTFDPEFFLTFQHEI